MSATDNCATEEQLINKKPLVLTVSKYNSILNKYKNDEAFEQAREEKKYMEYLKEGSNKLKQKWTTNLNQKENSSGETVGSRKMKDKAIEEQKHQQEYKELKENDEKIRLEKIAKAKQMLQREEPGPKELESAFMFTEVLKARNTQINFQNERKYYEKEKRFHDNAMFNQQAGPWIENEQKRILQSKKRNDDYRAELFDCIKVQNKNKFECAKYTVERERRINEQIDQEVRNQIEKEKAVLQRKKETMRKNALEAMLMVEQRRQREKVESKIEDHINSIYIEGKHEMSMNKKEMDKNELVEKQKATAESTKHIPISTTDQEDDKRYKKDLKQFCIKYDAQEREKIKREKDLKAAKIHYYVEEAKRQKALQERKNEEFKWATANRLKNEEVSMNFLMEQNREKAKRQYEIRNALLGQIEDRKEIQKLEKEWDQRCSAVSHQETDKFFFNYANTLINDAESKSRPTYPLLKTVEHYKRSNNINPRTRELPHLKTKISIGRNYGSSIKYDLNELKQLNPKY